MKTSLLILSVITIIPLLSGCASSQKVADSGAPKISPVFNVRHSTETPAAYYQMGRYYQEKKSYEQALLFYQKALGIDGTFTEAFNGCGVSYAQLGKQKEAIEQFRLALKQRPNAAHLHNNLGYALLRSGSYTEAVSELQHAVALEPSNQFARANLALALDKAGEKNNRR
jgi:Flp pilus assembly protein TadD